MIRKEKEMEKKEARKKRECADKKEGKAGTNDLEWFGLLCDQEAPHLAFDIFSGSNYFLHSSQGKLKLNPILGNSN